MNNFRFKHYVLSDGNKLTTCIQLNKSQRVVEVGFYIWQDLYNRRGEERKKACFYSCARMAADDLCFSISKSEPLNCDYINLRSLLIIQNILKNSNQFFSNIDPSKATLYLHFEMCDIIHQQTELFFQRIGAAEHP